MEEDERKGAGRCGDFTSRYNSISHTDKKKRTELVTQRFPLRDVINMRIHVLLMSYSILALRPHPRPLVRRISPTNTTDLSRSNNEKGPCMLSQCLPLLVVADYYGMRTI